LQDPHNAKGNYGSADYDVRHYLSASMVLSDMFRHAGFRYGPKRIFGGWTLSSNWFFRTGLPVSVIDNANLAPLLGLNYNGVIFASPNGAVSNSTNCGSAVNTPCLSTGQFAPSGALTGFGTLGRNFLRGPHFFDVDLGLMKDVAITEHVVFFVRSSCVQSVQSPEFRSAGERHFEPIVRKQYRDGRTSDEFVGVVCGSGQFAAVRGD
jgi:hypothetical protein